MCWLRDLESLHILRMGTSMVCLGSLRKVRLHLGLTFPPFGHHETHRTISRIMHDHAGARQDHPWSRGASAVLYHQCTMITSDHSWSLWNGMCTGHRDIGGSLWFTTDHAWSSAIIRDPTWSLRIIMNHRDSQWSRRIPHEPTWLGGFCPTSRTKRDHLIDRLHRYYLRALS